MTTNQPDNSDWNWKRDLAIATSIFWFMPLVALVGHFGKETVAGWYCRIESHNWADEHRYGGE